ncbi:MAG: hypothetical protein V4529_05635 [Gemmatimonadota bacterium]
MAALRGASHSISKTAMRPMSARNLASPTSRAALGTLSFAYLLVNTLNRAKGPTVEKYDYGKALHAARLRLPWVE